MTLWFQHGKQNGQITVQMTQGLIRETSLWQLTKSFLPIHSTFPFSSTYRQVILTDHKLSLNLSTPHCLTYFHSDQNTITHYNTFLNYYATSDREVLRLTCKTYRSKFRSVSKVRSPAFLWFFHHKQPAGHIIAYMMKAKPFPSD